MITPVNGHLIIEPVKADDFVLTDKGKYEEIGTVIAIAPDIYNGVNPLFVGDKVYFDSWLAAKYPKNDREYFWLVRWQDVRAVENAD